MFCNEMGFTFYCALHYPEKNGKKVWLKLSVSTSSIAVSQQYLETPPLLLDFHCWRIHSFHHFFFFFSASSAFCCDFFL